METDLWAEAAVRRFFERVAWYGHLLPSDFSPRRMTELLKAAEVQGFADPISTGGILLAGLVSTAILGRPYGDAVRSPKVQLRSPANSLPTLTSRCPG